MYDANKTSPAWIMLLLIILVSCSRLPNFSQPRVEVSDVSLSSQVISYRNLTIADFNAEVLPEDLRRHRQDLNAHAAIAIRTLPGAKYVFSFQDHRGSQLWCGSTEHLSFEAVMLTEKSWWNSTMTKDIEDYVLQHEQVHFALMELAARKLNRRVKNEQDQLVSCAAVVEDAKEKLSAIVDLWIDELQKETLRKHEDFDEATSRRYALKIQQWWLNRVKSELLEFSD